MYKIGMIGDRDSVLGFMALGFTVHEAENAESAEALLHERVKSGEYAVIYLCEDYAEGMQEALDLYKDTPLPAISLIPGSRGGTGYGLAAIKHAVERAVGADILFKED